MIDFEDWFFTGPFESKLGVKFVSLVLACGLIPIVLIAFPLYYTTLQTMKDRGREQVKNYLRLTSGRLFQTLRTAENEIERLTNAGASNYHPETSVFGQVEVVQRSQAVLNSDRMPWDDFSSPLYEKLAKGDVVLSPPYDNGQATVVSVLAAYREDEVIIGELKPTELWQAGRASYIGGSNMFVVVNNNGIILNSSNHDYFKPLTQVDKSIFSSEQKEFVSGQTDLAERGKFFWGKKTLYLKARFGSGIWHVYMLHPLSEVYSLPAQLVRTITVFLVIAFLIFVFLALRFSRRMVAPIEYLIGATKKLTEGEYGRTVTVETGDELEVLANDFNEMSESLAKTIRRKEVLLKEVHHRVKNNLQIIISLLSLQSNQVESEQELGALEESENRIQAMALLHDKLYSSDDVAQVRAKDYVQDLVQYLRTSYSGQNEAVSFHFQIDEELELEIDRTIPCGLIINELVANALEHAFGESVENPEVRVLFKRLDGKYQLSVQDNGRGMDEDFDPREAGSLGFKIIQSLVCRQLRGEFTYSVENGTKITIEFPEAN